MTWGVKRRSQHFTVVSMKEVEHDKWEIMKDKSTEANCYKCRRINSNMKEHNVRLGWKMEAW